MRRMNLKLGATLALMLLAACGGTGPIPVGITPDPEPQPSGPDESNPPPVRSILVSGEIALLDGSARVDLDVMIDGATVHDAAVELDGHALSFDAAHAGYSAEIPLDELPASGLVPVDVRYGEATQRRAVMIPGEFVVQEPRVVPVGGDFTVAWNEAAGATRYRVSLAPQGGILRGGELGSGTRKYTFNGLDGAGSAQLEVSAVSENFESNELSRIDVLRIHRRTLSIVEPPSQPESVMKVGGRLAVFDDHAEVELALTLDGGWTRNARVLVAGNPVNFDAAHQGYYAQIPIEKLPVSGPILIEAVQGNATLSRAVAVPGAFEVQAPGFVTVGSDFAIGWSEASEITRYRLSLTPPGELERGGELAPSVRKYVFDPVRSAGIGTLEVTAVASMPGDEDSQLEVLRTHRRIVNFIDR